MMLLGTMAIQAQQYDFSAVAPSGQTLYYTITGSNTVSVVRKGSTGVNPTGDVTIPSTVQNNSTSYTVTGIGDYAFSYCSVTSVTIPSSITSIGGRIFYNCNSLTTVNYNATNCTSVGSSTGRVFEVSPSSLTTINIGNNVTHLPDYVFSSCIGITSITIPSSITHIGSRIFYGCSGLTTVNFNATNCVSMNPSSSESVFLDCPLTTLNIGSNVSQIPNKAFRGCANLTTVNFNATNCTYMGNYSNNVFYNCANLATVNIGNNVTQIPAYAFANCSSLTGSMTIPNSVTSIGNHAFSGCSGLTALTIGNSVTSIGGYAFNGCSGLTSLTIPNSVTSIGGSAFHDCSGLTFLSISNSVTTISSKAFSGCSGLTSLIIPNSVTSIDFEAFRFCSGLTAITIPNSVTSIGNNAFWDCSGLTTLTIPNSVTSIGNSAFSSCSSLTTVNFNADSCTYMGTYSYCAFSGSITTLNIGNNVKIIPGHAFSRCYRLTGPLTIPNSVTSIGSYAFQGCSGLTALTIGSSVTSISNEAFRGCGLSSVVCMSVYPPTAQSNTFTNIPSSCTLTVPCGSLPYYNATEPWNSNFQQKNEDCPMYTVTAVSGDPTMGSVSGGGTYNSGATATLTATPNSGYRFVRWQDNNTQNPRTVTVTANATYTATFEAIPPTQYTITVNSNNNAWGTVSGGGTYNSGATATLTATPNSDYRFVRWQDNNTDNPRTVTVTANVTYTAYFEAETQGIDDVAWNGIDLIMHGTTLIISGVSDERMSITDMMGRTIHSANGSGSIRVELPVAGVYFVRVGDRPARKIMVVR